MGAYSKKKIVELVDNAGLFRDYIDVDTQVTPNGFDMTLASIEELTSPGRIDYSNEERVLSDTKQVQFDEQGWAFLQPGTYRIVYNEIVSIPLNAIAIARTRSSLLRCGVSIETGVWDAGYCGRSSSMLNVANPHGMYLKKDARVLQLVFFDLDDETESYSGAYQNENVVE
jgi:dUTP pyrophosphatase